METTYTLDLSRPRNSYLRGLRDAFLFVRDRLRPPRTEMWLHTDPALGAVAVAIPGERVQREVESPYPTVEPPPDDTVALDNGLIDVATAAARYLGGQRSRRWWYAKVQAGDLEHHRLPGGGVLLDTQDCVAFEQTILGAKVTTKRHDREAPPPPAAIPTPRRTPSVNHPRLKFFGSGRG